MTNIFLALRFAVRWIIRLALLGMLIGWLAGCTTVGIDHRPHKPTTTAHEALRDFSEHATRQQPTCAWYPATMSMICE